jgi:molybdenum cofactor cytidylyltransferase
MNNLIPNVGAVILAAGASKRMGTPKQLLHFNGRSFLCHTTEVALASICKPVVVVLGRYAEKMRHEIDQQTVVIVENQEWYKGMGASISVGIKAINNTDIEAVVLLLCDQPFVNSDVINKLVETYRTTHKPIIASEYVSTLGVPALFSRDLFLELMSLEGEGGAKQIIRKYSDSVFSLPFTDGAIDIDTPQDYEQLLQNI